MPRVINVICDRSLLGGYSQDRHRITGPLVRNAASEVFGKRFTPPWLPWAGTAAVAAILAVGSFALWRLQPWDWIHTRAPAATAVPRAAAKPVAPVRAAAARASGASADRACARRRRRPRPARRPSSHLSTLLAKHSSDTSTDAAFTRLFDLWGIHYTMDGTDPCTQATQHGLACLTERGSLGQLRLYNRPAILILTDANGGSHEVVLTGLDGEHASIDLGKSTHQVGDGELSTYWMGDYVMLWQPETAPVQTLSPGMSGQWCTLAAAQSGEAGGCVRSRLAEQCIRCRPGEPRASVPAQSPAHGGRYRGRPNAGRAGRRAGEPRLSPPDRGARVTNMSFILDALKKSESDRQRQSGPSLFEVKVAPPRRALPIWAVAIAVLLGINVIVISWMLLRRPAAQQPAASPQPTAPAVHEAPAARAAITPPIQGSPASGQAAGAAPAATGVATPPPAHAGSSGQAPAPAPVASSTGQSAGQPSPATNPSDNAPAVEPAATPGFATPAGGSAGDLPLYQQIVTSDGLPALHLDMHVFAERPQDRFVMINMHRLGEGDSLPGGVHVDAIRPDGVVLTYQGTQFLLPRN